MIEKFWPYWYGGPAIAAVAILVLSIGGNYLAVTRGYVSACSIFTKKPYFHRKEMGGPFGFRTFFIIGIVIGGFLAAIINADYEPSFALGVFDTIWGNNPVIKALVLLTGGFLWGYGSRMAKGCTSGNSISGISRGSQASVVTSIFFVIGGSIMTHILEYIVRGKL
ncbi:MAG: YeeE/YedE family protein [Leptospiraceae bacterium]|nr:YeeE/YedE family protein [Leptospiraceae bacterium]MCP5502947.1 YeeE/YedE family protein [Leptospiraceae bacterium]